MFWDLTVSGVTLGSVYALIALGYSMVYGILKLLNFAHGDVYMIGAFIGYGMITAFGGPGNLAVSVWVLIVVMFVVSMVIASHLSEVSLFVETVSSILSVTEAASILIRYSFGFGPASGGFEAPPALQLTSVSLSTRTRKV